MTSFENPNIITYVLSRYSRLKVIFHIISGIFLLEMGQKRARMWKKDQEQEYVSWFSLEYDLGTAIAWQYTLLHEIFETCLFRDFDVRIFRDT